MKRALHYIAVMIQKWRVSAGFSMELGVFMPQPGDFHRICGAV